MKWLRHLGKQQIICHEVVLLYNHDRKFTGCLKKKKKKKKKKTKTFFEIGIIPLFIKESSKFLYGLSKMIFFALLKSPYIAVLKKEVTS